MLNQLVGPPLFKWAIHKAGESRLGAESRWDRVRDVLIFGLEDQSLALARQLSSHGWNVRIATFTRMEEEIDTSKGDMIAVHRIDTIDKASLESP